MEALIVAGVTAIGFTQTGIAAGSIAAWMMSVTGPVATGSSVALCQSIGATGAVSATTAAIANTTAGVAVGGVVVKVARTIRRRLNKDRPPSVKISYRGDRVAFLTPDEGENDKSDSEDEKIAEEASANLDLIDFSE